MLDFLAPRLAKWQLPDDVVFIDEVPKTSVGKFSKKDLRDPLRRLRPPRLTAPQNAGGDPRVTERVTDGR